MTTFIYTPTVFLCNNIDVTDQVRKSKTTIIEDIRGPSLKLCIENHPNVLMLGDYINVISGTDNIFSGYIVTMERSIAYTLDHIKIIAR